MIKPEPVFSFLRRNLESIGVHILAVAVRIIIGTALVVYAAHSRYPTAILIVGWVSIAAAVVLGIMGRSNFRRLMSWALNLKPSIGRMGGVIAVLFGGFLIHAAV